MDMILIYQTLCMQRVDCLSLWRSKLSHPFLGEKKTNRADSMILLSLLSKFLNQKSSGATDSHSDHMLSWNGHLTTWVMAFFFDTNDIASAIRYTKIPNIIARDEPYIIPIAMARTAPSTENAPLMAHIQGI